MISTYFNETLSRSDVNMYAKANWTWNELKIRKLTFLDAILENILQKDSDDTRISAVACKRENDPDYS